MIERIECRNFQSLRKVDLDLGRFTVIVGASSSGKSALMRAFRAVASNVRGGGQITRGQKMAAITVRTGEQVITLERTEAAGQYRLIDADGAEQTFTKLNGGVPEHITKALRIEPVPSNGTSVNFAGQFDRPYLLDETGANVARVLGELTNVNIIFEAVRQANKTRLGAASTLKTRKGDLAQLRGRLADYEGLSDRLKALQTAEELAEQAQRLNDQIARLSRAQQQLAVAESVLARASVLPEVPDITPALTARDTVRTFTGLLREMSQQQAIATAADERASHLTTDLADLNAHRHQLLVDAGQCPTCGQTTS